MTRSDIKPFARCASSVTSGVLLASLGLRVSACESRYVIKRGFDDAEPARQRYECRGCNEHFDDFAGAIFAAIIGL